MRRLATLVIAAGLAACGASPAREAASDAPRVVRFNIESRQVPRRLGVAVVAPAGHAANRGLLVFLHGLGQNETTFLADPLFKALRRLGARAPVVAFPYGGVGSYWHDRRGGAWGRYVTSEVVPQVVSRFGLDPKRVAIGGISMGGFGALDLAARSPRRFCAVGAHSPAIWIKGGLSAAGAFDDAEDFARHDVIKSALAGAFRKPVWLDGGTLDPFLAGARAFVVALRSRGARLTLRSYAGGHDLRYWNAHWSSYLDFYARELARC